MDAFVCGAGTGGTIAGVSNYLKTRKPSITVFLADPPGSSLHNKVPTPCHLTRALTLGTLDCLVACKYCYGREMQVVRGVLYTGEESEGRRARNPVDTITEGVGQNRLTANFARAQIDGSFKCSDQEAVDMVSSTYCYEHRAESAGGHATGMSLTGARRNAVLCLVQAALLLRREGLFVGSSAAVNCVGAVKVAELLGPKHTIVTILCDSGERHLSKFHSRDFLQAAGFQLVAE